MSRTVTALLPYYGSNRLLGRRVGELLAGRAHVAVPFAGGMSELTHIDARTLIVSDLNRFAINLANVLAHPEMGPRLIRDLRRTLFHEDELVRAQATCRAFAGRADQSWSCDYEAARAYFLCCWMSRSGNAGTGKEFTGGLSVRWDGGGGDSVTRLRSATEGLRDWRRLRHCAEFLVMDAFQMLPRVKDRDDTGVYADAPWPDDGDRYTHPFTPDQQRRLAEQLATFKRARVVVRYGDHPLIRELYPEALWTWHFLSGRTQTNASKAEVLIVNRLATD